MELKVDAEDSNGGSEIAAALEHILSQPDFLASPRLACFLRFVVTETLAGRADRLKAFTIASMALGHDEKFNPKTNSIVRVQAGRLRHLLEYYYRGPGRFDRCEIRLPRGSYAPEFLFRSEDDLLPQPPTSAPELLAGPSERAGDPPPFETSKRFGRLSRSLVFAASMVVVAGTLGLGAWIWRGDSPPALFAGRHTAFPIESGWAGAGATITVDPIEGLGDEPAMRAFTGLLENRLEDALSGFDSPVVLHRSAAAPPPSDLDYRLSGRVTQVAGGNISLAFRIWHPASGEIIWTRTFDDLHLAKTEAAFEPVVSALTSAVAQTYGVVFTDMRKRLSGESEGFGCVILASDYFKAPSTRAHAAARDCLERTLAQHADFAPGFAALSYLMVDTYLNGIDARPDEKPLDVAIETANRAVDLTPQKARAHAAVFLTRFFDKRFGDAFVSAEQALQLNPYATDTIARVGAAHVLRGEFDNGIALLQRAVRFNPSAPGWYEFPFFLDAHMRGDEPSAFRHAMRHSAMRFPLGIVARIITAHEQGDAAAVAQWTGRLVADYPAVAADIPAAFDRYAMAPEISNRLLADLGEAGFPLYSR
jgi:tetratricopeptide (TPR) repeat protein